MSPTVRSLLAGAAALFLLAPAATAATGAAPGAPGDAAPYLPADKAGVGTSTTTASKTWLTVQKEGGLGELFYPDLSTPSARALRFLVADSQRPQRRLRGEPDDERDRQPQPVLPPDVQGPAGRWQLTATYATDPARNTVLADVAFTQAKPGNRFTVYAIYEPALAASRPDNAGATDGDATHGHARRRRRRPRRPARVHRHLQRLPRHAATGRRTSSATGAWTGSTRRPRPATWCRRRSSTAPRRTRRSRSASVGSTTTALGAARASLASGFASVSSSYADGWHAYLAAHQGGAVVAGHARPAGALPRVGDDAGRQRGQGATAARTSPRPRCRGCGATRTPSGPYHLVWSRDLYQIATALIADGDTAGAGRALDFLFDKQQKADGSFPQNSTIDGTPFWGGLQLDEVAFPIVLAHQLRPQRRGHLVARQARRRLPHRLPAGRPHRTVVAAGPLGEPGRLLPATIASEIAGLVCAADIAQANGDAASARALPGRRPTTGSRR